MKADAWYPHINVRIVSMHTKASMPRKANRAGLRLSQGTPRGAEGEDTMGQAGQETVGTIGRQELLGVSPHGHVTRHMGVIMPPMASTRPALLALTCIEGIGPATQTIDSPVTSHSVSKAYRSASDAKRRILSTSPVDADGARAATRAMAFLDGMADAIGWGDIEAFDRNRDGAEACLCELVTAEERAADARKRLAMA